MSIDDPGVQAEICRLVAQGKKIEAIKQWQAHTGASLLDAKEAIETLEREGKLPSTSSNDVGSSLDGQIVTLIERGEKLQAVSLYRERTGASLKDAKDAVEAIAARRGAVVPGRSGCLGAVVAVAALACLSLLTA